MKPTPETAIRWLRQAEHDLTIAQNHRKQGDYSDACFMAEQASQKTLKAFLMAKGQRSVPIHSVAQLAERCADIDPDFKKLIAAGRILDQYYIPTRYPDALAPPAVPFESYTEEQAQRAVKATESIYGLVAKKVNPPKKP
ncbi:MAG: HEPN domain-containing protein [Deltaproteobacteria bacterium]|nr:HEPN domain-containing protein [Deltaproteobacteria bacterium]MDZ4346043.1 HEPN domain-containing protein [Candidatus Binatia bacterium]